VNTIALEPVPSLHSTIWQSAPRHAEWQLLGVITGGLAIDAMLGWPGQIMASVWAIAIFGWLLFSGGYVERCALVACLGVATVGEVTCSLVWGLYDYQFHNVPVFVLPGHALLMTLGILYARRLSGWIVWLVPLAVLPYVATGWWQGWDTAGMLLFAMFAICVMFGRAKRLYTTMFLLSLLMEIYGTWLGNWTWRQTIPGTHLTTLNPPVCAGAFYCALDLIVLAALSIVGRYRNLRPKVVEENLRA
jgi:hypothetical protein